MSVVDFTAVDVDRGNEASKKHSVVGNESPSTIVGSEQGTSVLMYRSKPIATEKQTRQM